MGDGRIRFLNQFNPEPTKVDYLKCHQNEESRLRAVIRAEFPDHMPELDIALNCGLRRKEQYIRIDWNCVDLKRRDLYVPPSKYGKSRHIPLNEVALAAFYELYRRSVGKGPIFVGKDGERLLGSRHWFEEAVGKAGVRNFTWHDIRHSFASRLVMRGVSLRIVAELLGHKHIQMTMRYAHLAPGQNRAAVEQLDVYNRGLDSVILGDAPGEATESKTETGPKLPVSAGLSGKELRPFESVT